MPERRHMREARYTLSFDLFSKEIVLFPVCLDSPQHWVLVDDLLGPQPCMALLWPMTGGRWRCRSKWVAHRTLMIVYFKSGIYELSTISRDLPTMVQFRRKVPQSWCLGTLELRNLDTLEPIDDAR